MDFCRCNIALAAPVAYKFSTGRCPPTRNFAAQPTLRYGAAQSCGGNVHLSRTGAERQALGEPMLSSDFSDAGSDVGGILPDLSRKPEVRFPTTAAMDSCPLLLRSTLSTRREHRRGKSQPRTTFFDSCGSKCRCPGCSIAIALDRAQEGTKPNAGFHYSVMTFAEANRPPFTKAMNATVR
jgi:hypothetical protein